MIWKSRQNQQPRAHRANPMRKVLMVAATALVALAVAPAARATGPDAPIPVPPLAGPIEPKVVAKQGDDQRASLHPFLLGKSFQVLKGAGDHGAKKVCNMIQKNGIYKNICII